MPTLTKDVTMEDIEKAMSAEQMEFVLLGARAYLDAVTEIHSVATTKPNDTDPIPDAQ